MIHCHLPKGGFLPHHTDTRSTGQRWLPKSYKTSSDDLHDQNKSGWLNCPLWGKKWKWKWKLLSRVWLFATPWTIWSMGFSRPEYWSLSLFQGILPTQGSNPSLPHCSQILCQLSHQGSPKSHIFISKDSFVCLQMYVSIHNIYTYV